MHAFNCALVEKRVIVIDYWLTANFRWVCLYSISIFIYYIYLGSILIWLRLDCSTYNTTVLRARILPVPHIPENCVAPQIGPKSKSVQNLHWKKLLIFIYSFLIFDQCSKCFWNDQIKTEYIVPFNFFSGVGIIIMAILQTRR